MIIKVDTLEAQDMIFFGEWDYLASRVLFNRGGFPLQAIYFGHQALEKHLKAILIENGKTLDEMKKHYSHNLPKILEDAQSILKELDDSRFLKIIKNFNKGVEMRYSDDMLNLFKKNQKLQLDVTWLHPLDYSVHFLKKQGLITNFFKGVVNAGFLSDHNSWRIKNVLTEKNRFNFKIFG